MPVQDIGTAIRECVACKRCFDSTAQFCPDCFVELVSLELIPRLINARYRLDHLIGSGSFGRAFLTRDLIANRDVVVKVVRAAVIAEPQVQDRFLREARLAAHLHHPQIGALFDYGMLPDASAYLVLELVYGNSLRSEMKQHGKFPPGQAVLILTEIASALGIAHQAGLVHRALKPESIALLPSTQPGRLTVKLFDFGLAVLTRTVSGNKGMTRPLTYTSPGLLRGEEADPQSDIYSLGVIAYEMLAGKPPYAEAKLNHQPDAVTPLRAHCPEIHPLIESAIMKSLSRNSWQRQQSAAEFKRDLLRATNIG